ncbi:WD40 repeat-like protein [Leucogyrophana mollusca]|uniref:WD40 repeat-like protein n=1 Tax=Leucogyrophana mollusca TaxID=85980 RepID=A0ACB8BJ14_9AGAM|nr:WD40 repeat-like protein [Leucogyrophana mollusca]
MASSSIISQAISPISPTNIPASESRPFPTNVLKGHTQVVQSIAYTPDGRIIVSGSHDGTIRIWQAATGEPLGSPLEAQGLGIWSVAVSPDGKKIVAVYLGATPVCIWDFETRRIIHTLDAGCVFSVAISPDGHRAVTGSNFKKMQIWDMETGALIMDQKEEHSDTVAAVTWSADGKKIASSSYDNTVRVWDAANGSVIAGPFQAGQVSCRAIVFSHDGHRLICGDGYGNIEIRDVQDGRVVNGPLTGHKSGNSKAAVVSLSISLDGGRFVSGSGEHAVVWDALTGQLLAAPLNHGAEVHCVSCSPDGKFVASSAVDGTICIWDIEASIADYNVKLATRSNQVRNTVREHPLDQSILDLPAIVRDEHGSSVPSKLPRAVVRHTSYDSLLDLPAIPQPHLGNHSLPRRHTKPISTPVNPPPDESPKEGRITRLWSRVRKTNPNRDPRVLGFKLRSKTRDGPPEAPPPVVDVPHAQDFPVRFPSSTHLCAFLIYIFSARRHRRTEK